MYGRRMNRAFPSDALILQLNKSKNTIVEPEHQKVLFKTRALVVLPFFSCKEAAWPSG